ncbi:haloalkane dehalogenase [Actinomadura barringtoniae]|uniref:Haloalkane dehalogenase n=1 Tax=Actinomadura barringtoniae TaxID=1427535 RepID=A0A939T3V8_9ACTN|nr:haloalkane dehalogenase [Actinomadura barringtoniae]MBO2451746.1 haloalkane dehalogenase [Actinomadura barringtoniae]
MRMLRTPDDRFADLPDFPFEPRYAEIPDQVGGTLRMAYVEAGPADGPVVLCLHGEPSWSFLYRHVIRVMAAEGLRVIAPDLVGFGRSDKPTEINDHSYARHIEWTRSLVFDALDLRDVTLVGQDWGGLIGLRLAVAHPGRFARIVAANTGLPTGDFPMPETWMRFRQAVRTSPEFDVARGIQSGCRTELPEAVRAAYDAPFPDESFKAGPRAMPGLVPAEPDDPEAQPNRDAWDVLRGWDKPFLVAFSDQDPITGPMAPLFLQLVPGAASLPQAGLAHPTIEGAGHFLQEDEGERLGREIVTFVRGTP